MPILKSLTEHPWESDDRSGEEAIDKHHVMAYSTEEIVHLAPSSSWFDSGQVKTCSEQT